MKKIFILLLVLTQIGCNNQDESKPLLKPEVKVDEDGNSLLWMITGENLKDTSYLFGTMHMIQKEYFIFPEDLKAYASNADVMVMEIAGIPDPMEMVKYIKLPEGESMFDYFNEEQTDTLINWVTENTSYSEKIFRAAFGKMKPFALVQLTALNDFQGDTESYEEDFTEIAKKYKIELIGLETIEDQMKIFDNLEDDEMTEMIMESLRDQKASKELMDQVQAVYHHQLIDSLYSLVKAEGGTISEKENEFLSDRNKNWIPKISKIIQKKGAFIAVGAGHLGGSEGVISLLKKEGYTLTPIQL